MSVQLDCIQNNSNVHAGDANKMEPQTSNQVARTEMHNARADVIEELNGLATVDRMKSVNYEDHDHNLTSPLIDSELSDILPCLSTKQAKLQGIVFLEDALQYRSIHHRANVFCLRLYRWFYSAPIRFSVVMSTFLILILAFFEEPSSLSWSSDPRRKDPR